jgi:outer membrane protein OmpA-like peptidoglycan-associated protein
MPHAVEPKNIRRVAPTVVAPTAAPARHRAGPSASVFALSARPTGRGRRLDAASLEYFGTRFRDNFDDVRLHDQAADADLAHKVGAQAFTFGTDIWLGGGMTVELCEARGRRLLAHELTHVVQQRRAPRPQAVLVDGGASADQAETEAVRIAEIVESGGSAPVIAELAASEIQRQQTDQPPGSGRAAEIQSSRASPGAVTITLTPPGVSLFEFAIDGDSLKPVHELVIRVLGPVLRRLPPDVLLVDVVGHADSTGSPAINVPLSIRRARNVARELGRAAGRTFEFGGRGEREPVAIENTAEARGRNRRVDIRFIGDFGIGRETRTPGSQTEPPGRRRDGQPGATDQEAPQGGGETPERRPTDTDQDFCEQNPIICVLGGLVAALGLGALAAAVLDFLAGLGGLAGLLELLRRLIGGPRVLPPGGRPPRPSGSRRPPTVVIGRIRHFNTPTGMPDRIPPGPLALFTPVTVTVVGLDPASPPVIISANAGPRSGSVEVDGGATTSVFSSRIVRVEGVRQTALSARPIALTASWAGLPVATSPEFSVAAIPIFMRQSFQSALVSPTFSGIIVIATWRSDSGSKSDLDEVSTAEAVDTLSQTGCFIGAGFTIPAPIPATGVGGDQHGAKKTRMQSPGVMEVQQTHKILERRTLGLTGFVSFPRSGYRIRLEVTDPDPTGPTLDLNVRKFGQAGSATGVASDAGVTIPSAGIDQSVAVPRLRGGGPPPPTGPPTGTTPVPAPAGGGAPSTPVTPRPFVGPALGGSTPLFYRSGLPNPPAPGEIHTLTLAFSSASGLHTVDLNYLVIEVRSDVVTLRSTNVIPLNVAPVGEPPLVLRPLTPGVVPRSRL